MTDEELMAEFLTKGIVKIPVESIESLQYIRQVVCKWAIKHSNKFIPPSEEGCMDISDLLNGMMLNKDSLNEVRVAVINSLNKEPQIKQAYFSLAQHAIETLVGNELVMQRNINLSIQLPGDDSSLLPIHCDTWSGDSPYEVVLWVPLVDCYGTKSMFFCDKDFSDSITELSQFPDAEALYQHAKPFAPFIDCKYGECLIFTQNVMHGNRVNETNETRWSLNCRFKSALAPYSDKRLGEFFEPITLRPATRLGAQYEFPRV